MKKSLILLLVFISPYTVWGKLTQAELDLLRTRTATAILLNGDKVDLDGKLDEPAWRLAKWESNFIQRNPNDGTRQLIRQNSAYYMMIIFSSSEPGLTIRNRKRSVRSCPVAMIIRNRTGCMYPSTVTTITGRPLNSV
jgi:hypothetical protein